MNRGEEPQDEAINRWEKKKKGRERSEEGAKVKTVSWSSVVRRGRRSRASFLHFSISRKENQK